MFVGGSNHVFIPELKERKLCDVSEESKTQHLLTKLESFFPTIVTIGKKQSYLEEVNSILVDEILLKAITVDGSI